ncbi:uncharacterized protein K452DRAFT_290878 [Aplosporella prunicola CBS 121167]|uniref:DUF7053 domain-containing protein n=1 Tax=Aplosporella prunicola CBS 121167 TaxID=1176127 RepID=A0A6A6B250_9PEZI|nr:uncharacterized protein K452DRAFT_290878 [Aplosporella prunicola CBS 121167]KAF2138292.1 hypothetical protein K452DRAFT_290878 [Aplosporella prunicola CBS 121167]
MPTTNVSTPLPDSLTEAQVLKALHNHELMIQTLCPALVSYEIESGDASSTAVYKVTDKKPIGQTTYLLTLTNVENGVDSLVNASSPVGKLTIAGQWRIEGGRLTEDVEIDGNMVTKKMAKGNVEKTHPEQQAKLLEEAGKA